MFFFNVSRSLPIEAKNFLSCDSQRVWHCGNCYSCRPKVSGRCLTPLRSLPLASCHGPCPWWRSQPVQSLLSETTTPYTEIVPGIVGSLELEPEIVGSEMNKFGWWFTEFATCSSCSSGSQRFWATISHISHASLSHADLDPLSHAGWDGRHGPGWILISTVQLRWFFWILLYDLYDCCIFIYTEPDICYYFWWMFWTFIVWCS